ncbi:NAD-dependent epimerase/dehydratase family protein [bacterium]|nr:NAD-dependent epimerase/dehydratase family protein [bacterium]
MPEYPLPSDDLDLVFSQVGESWESLRSGNIFITGGTGFFGIWLLETFIWANDALSLGAKMVVLTRNPAAFKARCPHLAKRPDIHLHQGDVRDFIHPEGQFSHVIHAATETSVRSLPSDTTGAFHAITDGTRHVLDFTAESGAERFLYISSGAVYGRQPPELPRLPESFSGAPNPYCESSYYGEAKRASEFLCAAHARTHDYVMNTARCFAFIGPHLPLDGPYAIGNFIRDGLEGNPICVTGDGCAVRSYLYAADLAAWLWRILITGHGNCSYNVGSEQSVCIQDLADLVRDILNVSVVDSTEPLVPSADHSRYVPDTSLAHAELDLVEWTPLSEAIRKTVSWLVV